jgi:hypothetical protein
VKTPKLSGNKDIPPNRSSVEDSQTALDRRSDTVEAHQKAVERVIAHIESAFGGPA